MCFSLGRMVNISVCWRKEWWNGVLGCCGYCFGVAWYEWRGCGRLGRGRFDLVEDMAMCEGEIVDMELRACGQDLGGMPPVARGRLDLGQKRKYWSAVHQEALGVQVLLE